jgi:DNA-binding protein YbaB
MAGSFVEFDLSGLADSLIARMVAQRDLLEELDDRFAAISARVASPDEAVSVEVDGQGAMIGLWLGPHALELDAEALEELIVDTAAAAARDALDHQNRLVDELNDRMRALRETPLTLWDGTTIETH